MAVRGMLEIRAGLASGELQKIRRAVSALKANQAGPADLERAFAGRVLKKAVYCGGVLDDEFAVRCELVFRAIRGAPAVLARCKKIVSGLIREGVTREDFLAFDSISDLSPEFAEAIATYDGGISLNGLRSLPAETADALASHRDGFLSLDGLR